MGSRRTCVCFSLLHEHRRPLIANIKAFSAVTAAADDAQTRAAQRVLLMTLWIFWFVKTTQPKIERINRYSVLAVGSKRKRNEFIMIDRLRPYTRKTSSHHIAFWECLANVRCAIIIGGMWDARPRHHIELMERAKKKLLLSRPCNDFQTIKRRKSREQIF